MVDAGPGPEEAVARAELRRRVWRAIAALSADHREIVVLRSDDRLVGKLLAFAPASGVALLFLSVLIDRLKAMRTDPYRRVQK